MIKRLALKTAELTLASFLIAFFFANLHVALAVFETRDRS